MLFRSRFAFVIGGGIFADKALCDAEIRCWSKGQFRQDPGRGFRGLAHWAAMDLSAYIDAVQTEGNLLAATAERAGLDAEVPTCPGWQVRRLVQHVGVVHRWAAGNVAGARAPLIGDDELATMVGPMPDDDDLLGWFRSGHTALIAALREAPDDLECATFLPAPSPLLFWARRQAHETGIHRADAYRAAGIEPTYNAKFAADGIDEIIAGFVGSRRRWGKVDQPANLRFRTTDDARSWTVRLSPEGSHAARGGDDPGEVDCTVEGPASDIYLLLWNRRSSDGLTMTGDPDMLLVWRYNIRIRWS